MTLGHLSPSPSDSVDPRKPALVGLLSSLVCLSLTFNCTPFENKWDALFDTATGKQLRLSEHQATASAVVFSPDWKLSFAAGWLSDDGSVLKPVMVSEVETGREIRRWYGHRGSVLALAISPDGRLLASGGDDNTIRIWEVATGRELAV